jgi:hypothetical protein
LKNTTGANNTASGVFALFDNTTGDSNTATGLAALGDNTTGSNNTAELRQRRHGFLSKPAPQTVANK